MNLKPGYNIFAVNSLGRVFSLSRESGRWRDFEYLGLEFKRIAAYKNVIWGIGGDHQVYVFVYGVEIPIRVKEVAYENERWNPIDGFSANLLPTDRFHFSNVDGTADRTKESIHLPTMAWQWEDEWYIDTMFDSVQLPIGGWTYAVDFPAEYRPKKGFTSCVRRRKWIRYRRYVATDSWSAVPGLHRDAAEEPFIDVSVGGSEIPGGNEDEMMVWTVTVAGRVMVRQGVTATNPEGLGWLHINTPERGEVSQISCAPSGLVWAVTWHGVALVRLGVCMLNPTGINWCEVGAPSPEHPLQQVCVGTAIVWGVSREGTVWFRQGVRSECVSADSDHLAKGTRWIQMVGEVSVLSIGPGDQLFGIGHPGSQVPGCEERPILFRTGVSPSDVSGKTWKPLTAQTTMYGYRNYNGQRSRSQSIASRRTNFSGAGGSASGSPSRPSTLGASHSPLSRTPKLVPKNDDNKDQGNVVFGMSNENFKAKGKEAANKVAEGVAVRAVGAVAGAALGRVPIVGPVMAGVATQMVAEEIRNIRKSNEDLANKQDKEACDSETSQKNNIIDQSMYESAVENLDNLKVEDKTENDVVEEQAKNSRKDSVDSMANIMDWEDKYDGLEGDMDPLWVSVTSGSCLIDPNQPPQVWFMDTMSTNSVPSVQEDPWRKDILSRLKAKNQEISGQQYEKFEEAVERSSWVKKGSVRVNTGEIRSKWEQANLELEQCGSREGVVDFGTLSIFSVKSAYKEHFSLSEITCISICSERSSPQVAIYTSARSKRLQPVLLRFSGDKEMEEWHASITTGMNAVHRTTGTPSNGSVVSVTTRGEVMLFDPSAAKDAGEEESSVTGTQYSQEIDVVGKRVPVVEALENSFAEGSSLYTEIKIGSGCDSFSVNLVCGKDAETICFHFNPRIFSNQTVLNTYQNGAWGVEEHQSLIVMMDDGTAVRAFQRNLTVQIVIKAGSTKFEIIINGVKFCAYKYRIRPENVTHFKVQGDVQVVKAIYTSKSQIVPPSEMYWRNLGGGHLLQCETGPSGVLWGLGYDSTAWVYTGGWGGAHFRGVGSSSHGVNAMHDTRYFYIYENQRWNPLGGFTTHGLPTDRYMWSDKTGKHSATKESVKLPSLHWAWTGDWVVDYHTPGGVDKDGWQYATDFPSTYHSAQAFTDYVRRRRWARKCKLHTTGPWKELGATRLLDISITPSSSSTENIAAWAVATNGNALMRQGVSQDRPEGYGWTHVHSDVLFQAVTVGVDGSVWLVSNEGQVYLRQGITEVAPTGQVWIQLQKPDKGEAGFKSVTRGKSGLWAVDGNGKLWLRRGIQPQFPEGTSWVLVSSWVRSVSAGQVGDMWAVLDNVTSTGGRAVNGVLARRAGITPNQPQGTDWDVAIGGGWKQVSVRGWVK